jgi:hypothetical protein
MRNVGRELGKSRAERPEKGLKRPFFAFFSHFDSSRCTADGAGLHTFAHILLTGGQVVEKFPVTFSHRFPQNGSGGGRNILLCHCPHP